MPTTNTTPQEPHTVTTIAATVQIDSIDSALDFANAVSEYRHARNKSLFHAEQAEAWEASGAKAPSATCDVHKIHENEARSKAEKWRDTAIAHAGSIKYYYGVDRDSIDAHDRQTFRLFGISV